MPIALADIGAAVSAAHEAAKAITGGANASYIPYLASVPSDLLGVAVVTADGEVFQAGDAGFGFAIESISKVFTLALALEIAGPEAIRKKIGASATGLP